MDNGDIDNISISQKKGIPLTILDEIVENKYKEVLEKRQKRPLLLLRERITHSDRDFEGALRTKGMSVIAEIKRKSPSAGLIREDFDSSRIAEIYSNAGADAISVLTDEKYFGGHGSHLMRARRNTKIPLLRKDFIVDPYQIMEARVLGADAILLIAAILDQEEIDQFIQIARQLNMDSLVEVHDEKELDMVLEMETPASIVGINNRNLKTFDVSLDTSLKLKNKIPSSITCVSESGIKTYDDVKKLEDAGFDAILVGTTLMQSDDIGKKLRSLKGR